MSSEIQNSVLELFKKKFPEELTMNKISEILGIDRDTASKHIAILVALKKIEETKKIGSTKMFCYVSPDKKHEQKKIKFLTLSRRLDKVDLEDLDELIKKTEKKEKRTGSNED